MPSDSDLHRATGLETDGRTDGLSISKGDHTIRLKWHKLRRRAEDPAFHRSNLTAGLAAGASMEVDIRLLADGGFVCLHDPVLETETDGSGPVSRADCESIRELRQTDASGAAAGAAPLLLEELIGIVRAHAAEAADGAIVQLDLKLAEDVPSEAVVRRFGELVEPAARFLSLSGEDWPAVLRLGGNVAGLSLGFDPTPLLFDYAGDAKISTSLSEFAARVMSMAPRMETVYLHHSVFAAARDQDVDLVSAFHRDGLRVDCWTIGTDRADTEAQLRLAVESGVDQITTDTPGELQALWAAMTGRPG